jgi:hypothetical protein
MTSVPESRRVSVNAEAVVTGDDHAAPPPPLLPAEVTGAACPNCGENFDGRFCANCGEERVACRDYSLRHFLGEAFNILTSVESNLFRSFAALIARPGRLTAEYFRGRRKSYLKPLQLFIFCNVIFFFVQSYAGFNSLTTPLYVHLNMLPYSRQASALVERELHERQITYEEYRPRFDAAIDGQAKTLVIVLIPIFALPLLALYWNARRYYVEHLVFSTHFFAFFLLFLPALHLGLLALLRGTAAVGLHVPPLLRSDTFLTLLMLFLCGIYLWLALRRVYGEAKLRTTIKCVVLVAGIMSVVQLYRLILFFTTFYSI